MLSQPIAVEITGNLANQEWGHSFDEFVMKERKKEKTRQSETRE